MPGSETSPSSQTMTINAYDQIVESLKEKPVQKMEARKLCSVLGSLPKEHREYLYMFIIHHERIHGSGTKSWRANPYKGKTFDGGKGVKYNWMDLPPKLQEIFTRYIEIISTKE